MKLKIKTIFLLTALFVLNKSPGQTGSNAAGKTDTLRSVYDIGDSLNRAEWQKFDTKMHDWFSSVFLPKNKIKITCAHCTAVYMDLVFEIDSMGKIAPPKIIRQKICGNTFSNKQKEQIFTALKKITFSSYFKKRICYFRLGRALKC